MHAERGGRGGGSSKFRMVATEPDGGGWRVGDGGGADLLDGDGGDFRERERISTPGFVRPGPSDLQLRDGLL